QHSVQNEATVAEFILLGFCSTPALQRCLFGLFSALYSGTLMGNALVFLLICLDYCLHSPMYFFLCHLSIADICYASNNVPRMLRNLLGQGRTISFAGCGAQIHLYLIFALTECVLLAVMSHVRYVAICRPLRYALIMIWRLCLTLATVSWALAFVFGTLQASLALHLPFWGPCEVDHFCYEILAVLKLACTAATANKVLIFAVCVRFLLFPLALILISSLDTLATVLRIRSAPGWHKTFSHLWLKFEEDVEDGGERWSKPYVGTLCLHSLSELRSCISKGTVLLDICANSMEEIADMVLAQQEQSTEFDEHRRAQVREVLLRKHHHQNEKTNNLLPVVCSFADVSKRQSDLHLLYKPAQKITPCPSPTAAEAKDGVNRESRTVDLSKAELSFLKKIPNGAEASNVLVGELDFLHQPIVAFVRLSPAVLLSGMTEVPIPTRTGAKCVSPYE
ncbi:olfactory receptor 2A1/2A42-like, partial [Aquila chrysaetos chrysaetos]|uniref:olfactory receptor 2A1/2A42-like n=1 Tax=Aquila chrysaetos chrysaetos TaxID=223781 RepID=UPI00117671F6